MKEPTGFSTGEPGGEPESTVRAGNLWAPLENPKPDEILLKAVIGAAWDKDLRQAVVKIGDGKTPWKSLPRLMPLRREREFDRSDPIRNGPDADSRVWETPAKTDPTQPRNGTPAQCMVTPECASVPESQRAVAWGVEKKGYPPMFAVYIDWNFACRAAMEEYAEIVPLYRSPPAAWQLVHECERLGDEVARLRLNAEERHALDGMAAYFDTRGNLQMQAWGSLLRVLLRRLGGK